MTADLEQSFWGPLRRLTAARIGLPRAGASLATVPLLDFKLAHARARDAVHAPLDEACLRAELDRLGVGVLAVSSAAEDRQRFLLRPDLGRRLADGEDSRLASAGGTYDVVFVVTDGLSASAVQRHAAPVLSEVVPILRDGGWRIAPMVVVRHGRVAIGDAIAGLLGAQCGVILVGERPGLTSPDSMGAYLTWQPGPQTTDANRNCISNIRPGGIGYTDAAIKLTYLLHAMRTQGVSGIALKDNSEALRFGGQQPAGE